MTKPLVESGEVQFDGAGTPEQKEGLEKKVDATPEAFTLRAMEKVGAAFQSMVKAYDDTVSLPDPKMNPLVPYFLTCWYTESKGKHDRYELQTAIHPSPIQHLLPFFQREYPFLLETDVLRGTKPINLKQYCPLTELRRFLDFDVKQGTIGQEIIVVPNNPYLHVLMLPLRYRAFIAGMILTAEERGELTGGAIEVSVEDYKFTLPSSLLFAHAQRLGQTEMKDLIQRLSKLPLIGDWTSLPPGIQKR